MLPEPSNLQAFKPSNLQPTRYWLIPLLAVLAFAPVATFWFVSDDFDHLLIYERLPWPNTFKIDPGALMFYRPLSASLTWELGYLLFGTNAMPYHLVSLALHALVAWLLGRVVATISGSSRTGWIAGALFAVYPLSTEAPSWLASQWDLWAAACALGAVWGFAAAWKTHRKLLYALGLLAAFLGVLMKESVLPLPAVLPFVALAVELTPLVSEQVILPLDRRQMVALIRRAVLWSLPFALPSLLFVALRLATGRLGGYPGAATDWQHFLLNNLAFAALEMLMPLNRSVFSPTLAQVVGLLMAGGLLAGLILWGRRRWPLLLLASAWWLAFLMPVANLIVPDNTTGSGNRLLYFSLMGFCIAVSVVLSGLLDAPGRRRIGWVVVVVLLALALPTTWLQLQPWAQSSRQTRHIVDEIGRMIAPLPVRRVRLNVQEMPEMYKGSYVFVEGNGLESALAIFNHQLARPQKVQQLDSKELAKPFENIAGVYNLAFTLNPDDQLYYISELSGITVRSVPPTWGAQVWDYTRCGQSFPAEWQPKDATFDCVPVPQTSPTPTASYASFNAGSADSSLLLPAFRLDLSGARWVRLGVCARFPAKQEGRLGEWFWGTAEQPGWSRQRNRAFALDSTGGWRTYWTYLPASQLGKQLAGLRLDPVNDKLSLDIQWIAVDLIK